MSKSKTYQIETMCDNCDYSGKAFLPKGKKVNDQLSKTDCPNCGCTTLSKKIEKPYSPMTNPIVPIPCTPENPFLPGPFDRWPNRPWDSPVWCGVDGGPAKFPFGPVTHTSKIQRQYELTSQTSVMPMTN